MANGFYFCPPNCPKRKPGCQDHCGHFKERRAEFDRLKAKNNRYNTVDQYTAEQKLKSFDAYVKTKRSMAGHTWRRGKR